MEVPMYTQEATDLAPMLGQLRPEASLVDPAFASVDEAAALGECEALGLYDDGAEFTDSDVDFVHEVPGAVVA